MRKPLTYKLELLVLVKNRHCCCICQKDSLGREVLIHHIDGYNSNNVISNLAVLCLMHASQADAGLKPGKLGSGKKLKPDEVKEFKKIWERRIEDENKVHKNIISIRKRKQLEILYYYEINKIKNEILSLGYNNKSVKDKFSFLDQLVVEEFISGIKIRKILSTAYSNMALQTAGGSDELVKGLASSIWYLFIHLIGPTYVKITKEDLFLFKESINNIETLGSNIAEFYENKNTLNDVCTIIYDLGSIAQWYKLTRQKKIIIRALNTIKKAVDNYDKGGKKAVKEKIERMKIVDKTIKKLKAKYKTKENAWDYNYINRIS